MYKALKRHSLSPERERTIKITNTVGLSLGVVSFVAYKYSSNKSFGGEVGLLLIVVWICWIAFVLLTGRTDYQMLKQQLRDDQEEADNILKSVGVDPKRKARG